MVSADTELASFNAARVAPLRSESPTSAATELARITEDKVNVSNNRTGAALPAPPLFEEPCSFSSDVPLAETVEHLNSNLKDLDDVLTWAHKRLGSEGKLVQVTSFGASGMVILHRMMELGLLGDIPTASLDTLHLFPETYDFIERVKEKYPSMSLRRYTPRGLDARAAFVESHGEDLWRSNPDEYDHLVKVEPLQRALDELNPSAWITGRRGTQGSERAELPIFEVDHDDPTRVKINPLAHWSYDEVWEYIRKNDIPYNPLHDRGYKSIGDVQTTRPVARDADERSGRFLGLEGKTECGLHSRNRPKRKKKNKKDFKRTETV